MSQTRETFSAFNFAKKQGVNRFNLFSTTDTLPSTPVVPSSLRYKTLHDTPNRSKTLLASFYKKTNSFDLGLKDNDEIRTSNDKKTKSEDDLIRNRLHQMPLIIDENTSINPDESIGLKKHGVKRHHSAPQSEAKWLQVRLFQWFCSKKYLNHISKIFVFSFSRSFLSLKFEFKAKRKAIFLQMHDTEKSYVEALKNLVTVRIANI
jgi:hypothetical protein